MTIGGRRMKTATSRWYSKSTLAHWKAVTVTKTLLSFQTVWLQLALVSSCCVLLYYLWLSLIIYVYQVFRSYFVISFGCFKYGKSFPRLWVGVAIDIDQNTNVDQEGFISKKQQICRRQGQPRSRKWISFWHALKTRLIHSIFGKWRFLAAITYSKPLRQISSLFKWMVFWLLIKWPLRI